MCWKFWNFVKFLEIARSGSLRVGEAAAVGGLEIDSFWAESFQKISRK